MSNRANHYVLMLCFAWATIGCVGSASAGLDQLVEAEISLVFGEGFGGTPFVIPGGHLELGLGRWVGLSVGGAGVVASPKTLRFLNETSGGGGATAACRLYVRGDWPHGFGVGAAMSLFGVEGLAIAAPRAEIFYRFVLLSHLAIRIHGSFGGLFLWDTAPDDDRPGPTVEEGYTGTSAKGILIGLGVSLGLTH